MVNITHNIDIVKIDNSIKLLKKYITDTNIEALISILESLKPDPHNELVLAQASEKINNIGTTQGAVLTYAPYINLLLSDDPFGNY